MENNHSRPEHFNIGVLGNTHLHSAAFVSHPPLCEALLRKGDNVNATNAKGRTPLHQASSSAIVEILSKYGADIHARDKVGRTPLLIAALNSNLKVIEALLYLGADIEDADVEGKNALHLAVNCEQLSFRVVSALLAHGADINAEDKTHRTPLDYMTFGNMWNPRRVKVLRRVAKYFVFHIVSILATNCYVSHLNILKMRQLQDETRMSNEAFLKLRRSCDKEVKRLKNLKIGDSNISYYDFLKKDTSALAALLRNDEIFKAFKSDVTAVKFPTYIKMLDFKLKKGMRQKLLNEHSAQVLHHICCENDIPPLPLGCVEKVLGYLGNKDLENLCNAVGINPSITLISLVGEN